MPVTHRDDIHIVARNSDWSPDGIDRSLKENVYPRPSDWIEFLKWTCLALGVAMTTAGVVFFFAYNWQDLDKFVKIGLIGGIICILIGSSVLYKGESIITKALLTAACLMTGVLFAVFGQIYQTGANAFDFFLAWSIFSLPWVLVARFHILWLFWVGLLNVTLFFYLKQVSPPHIADQWPLIATLLNLFYYFILDNRPRFFTASVEPVYWLTNTLAGLVAIFASMGYAEVLIESGASTRLITAIALAAVTIFIFLRRGHSDRNLLLIAMVCLMVLGIGNSTIGRLVEGTEARLILNSLFTSGALFAMVLYLLRLNKTWKNERR